MVTSIKKDTCQKAVKGWNALCSAVHTDGKLGYVQPIGADPKNVTADDTDVYGVGAFMYRQAMKCTKTVSEK